MTFNKKKISVIFNIKNKSITKLNRKTRSKKNSNNNKHGNIQWNEDYNAINYFSKNWIIESNDKYNDI